MYTSHLLALVATLTAAPTANASVFPRQQTVSLGEVTFGDPSCGDGPIQSISASDCTSAISALFAAHCVHNICSIPAATDNAQESTISSKVGTCEVFVGVFVGGSAATFAQDSVANEFPGFISECVAPGTKLGVGNPVVSSTDGRLRLVFSNGVQE